MRRHGDEAMLRDRGERGQALVLFTLALTALCLMAALLLDGGTALVRRRQLQDAGDAAALAGSHQFASIGCSATAGPPPGTPRAEVVQAVLASLARNAPGLPSSAVSVSCAPNWNNFAVRVALQDRTQGTFLGIAGKSGFDVTSVSTAVNGHKPLQRNVAVILNPSHPTWSLNRGCPSVFFNGNTSLLLDGGSMQVNSACVSTDGGAVNVIGGSAQVMGLNGATVSVTGDVVGANITPPPLTGRPPVADPLAYLTPPNPAALPVRSSTLMNLTGDTTLQPGRYIGGWVVKGKVLLKPGIYYIDGGGIDMKGNGQLFSVNAAATTATEATWAINCTAASCGVLIYNSGGLAMGPINGSGGSVVMLRGYSPSADMLGMRRRDYENLLIWQDRDPAPSAIYAQPAITFKGSPTLQLVGGIYAPSAALTFQGNVDGTIATASTDATFIVHDLVFKGDSALTLRYNGTAVPMGRDYGLVE